MMSTFSARACAKPCALLAFLALLGSMPACSSGLYFAAMEKLAGKEMRQFVVERVMGGREEQEEAKEQIQEAYKTFQDLTGKSGGELETVYKRLSKEYDRSASAADDVTKSIAGIEAAANRMFSKWTEEIGEYSSPELRAKSEKLRDDTKRRYGSMLGAMRDAEASMDPVLRSFKDNVLYLKHNLNAQSVSDLQTTVDRIGGDVKNLIREMEASIQEADSFIQSMEKSGATKS